MLKYAYDKGLISGAICSGGSLGTVIPPSVTVIVLAPVASLPVGNLFAGMLLPGLIMSALFFTYIIIACWIRPSLAPPVAEDHEARASFASMIRVTVVALLPPVALIFAVLGTILLGWATPTEAAACGAFGSMVLAALHGRISIPVLKMALYRTLSITAMILLIVLGGSIFSGVFYASGGMTALQNIIAEYDLAGWPAVALILVITFVAGFMLDLISVILIVIPVAIPLVKLYGVDPLWFSIVFLIVLQTAYLTPPMAPSIFYLRAIAPAEITLAHMYRGVVPFIVMQLITVALVLVFTDLSTWLPKLLYAPG